MSYFDSVNGILAFDPATAPPTPVVGESFIYYDSASGTIKLSQNGSVASSLVGFPGAAATKTANYTITLNDSIIFANTAGGAFALTLPSPANLAGKMYRIIDSTGSFATNNLTLAPHAAEMIEGLAASKVLQTAWGGWTVTTDGTNWFIF